MKNLQVKTCEGFQTTKYDWHEKSQVKINILWMLNHVKYKIIYYMVAEDTQQCTRCCILLVFIQFGLKNWL